MRRINTYTSKEGWHVSYCYGGFLADTTAIVIGNHTAFFTLDGDHTKALKALDTLPEALKYFTDHYMEVNWSSEDTSLFSDEDPFNVKGNTEEALGTTEYKKFLRNLEEART